MRMFGKHERLLTTFGDVWLSCLQVCWYTAQALQSSELFHHPQLERLERQFSSCLCALHPQAALVEQCSLAPLELCLVPSLAVKRSNLKGRGWCRPLPWESQWRLSTFWFLFLLNVIRRKALLTFKWQFPSWQRKLRRKEQLCHQFKIHFRHHQLSIENKIMVLSPFPVHYLDTCI